MEEYVFIYAPKTPVPESIELGFMVELGRKWMMSQCLTLSSSTAGGVAERDVKTAQAMPRRIGG